MSQGSVRLVPEALFAPGLFACTYLLGLYTMLVAMAMVFPDQFLWFAVAVPVIWLGVLGFAFVGRIALYDFYRSLNPNESFLLGLAVFCIFWLPSLILKHWAPVTGFAITIVTLGVTLVDEKGYARFYMLCGVTCLLSLTRSTAPLTYAVLGCFLVLLLATVAYERFFFGVEGYAVDMPEGVRWLPLTLVLRQCIVAVLVTAPIAWATPIPKGLHINLDSGPRFQDPSPHGEIDVRMFEAFAYTIALVMAMLALAALYKWLDKRRRGTQGDMTPEAVGIPMGSARRLGEDNAPPTPDLANPMESVVYWYSKFSGALRNRELVRRQSQTPWEYRDQLNAVAVLTPEKVSSLTSSFVRARYESGAVGWDEAERFRVMAQELIAEAEGKDEGVEGFASRQV